MANETMAGSGASAIRLGARRGAGLGLCALVAAALAGCGDDAVAKADAAPDTSAEVVADAIGDAATDTANDTTPPRPELVVMSYNVMCSFCVFDDGSWDWDWDHRLVWLRDTIARHDPDLLGAQELADVDPSHPAQVAALAGDVYDAYFYRRTPDDAAEWDYPDATIYWKKARFDLLESGQFWLSETPDEAYSHGWSDGLAFTRLVVWVTLHDKVTGTDLTAASTHFDNNSPNQLNSAPLCLERFAAKAASGPVIFLGDFNSTPSSDAYGILARGKDGAGFHFEDAFDLAPDAPRLAVDDATPPAWDAAERIDHIWLAGASWTVSDWVVDLYTYGDKQQAASDHWAVAATVLPAAP